MKIENNIGFYNFEDKLIYNIDLNSNNFLTFNYCVEFIQENFDTTTIELYRGGWNISKFVFNFLEEEMTLIFDDFLGTELRIKNDINQVKKAEIEILVSATIKNLKAKILTK